MLKFHIFEIIDEFNTSEELLQKYALQAAETRAAAYGWELISVKRSERPPVREGNDMRHFFEMCGIDTLI